MKVSMNRSYESFLSAHFPREKWGRGSKNDEGKKASRVVYHTHITQAPAAQDHTSNDSEEGNTNSSRSVRNDLCPRKPHKQITARRFCSDQDESDSSRKYVFTWESMRPARQSVL